MGLGLARLFRRLPRQPTAHELRNFGLFSRPLPVPLALPYGPNFPDLFRRAGDHVGGEQPTEIAPELTGHGLPLSKCEAYNRVYDQF